MLLNLASRQYILNEALDHAFTKRKIALDTEYDRIAKALYDAAFPKSLQEHISALPATWYETNCNPSFNVGGHSRQWSFNGKGEHGAPRTNNLRLPKHSGWNTIGTISHPKHSELIERIATYDAAMQKYREERSSTDNSLRALLKGTKTLEQLKEIWPEGEKFYKGTKAAVPTPPGLPAVAMSDLNKMLGLAA